MATVHAVMVTGGLQEMATAVPAKMGPGAMTPRSLMPHRLPPLRLPANKET